MDQVKPEVYSKFFRKFKSRPAKLFKHPDAPSARPLSKNTTLETLKRAFTREGYSHKKHANAFDAIADYDDSVSRLAAGILGAPTLGLSILAHHCYQNDQIDSKEKDLIRCC